jgi:hypothetical protein
VKLSVLTPLDLKELGKALSGTSLPGAILHRRILPNSALRATAADWPPSPQRCELPSACLGGLAYFFHIHCGSNSYTTWNWKPPAFFEYMVVMTRLYIEM